jgi:hypothetical protein
MNYKWINMFPLGKVSGFVYFAAYINEKTNEVVGWVTRIGVNQPYAYNVYFTNNSGQVISDTRGSYKHARWAVQGAVADLVSRPRPFLAQSVNLREDILSQIDAAMRRVKLIVKGER